MRILIVTPAVRGDRSGNRVTALRWAGFLRSLGHRVRISCSFEDEDCDAMVALHAHKSHASLARFKERSKKPLIVALTGTDVYGKISAESRRSLEIADRIVVLQPRAILRLDPELRRKAIAIFQSAPAASRVPSDPPFVMVVGHLRPIKDPLRAAEASRLLPPDARMMVLHAGAALDPEHEARATGEMRENPRYRWLGSISRREVRTLLSQSRALVLSSLAEGGANVVCEAIRAGVPVLASRIEGTIGQLGEGYPGYFEPGDTKALSELLLRLERDPAFLRKLEEHAARLAPLFAPERERALWGKLIAELEAGSKSRLAIDDLGSPKSTFREDVIGGLTEEKKRLSCSYFYDEEGSRIFQEICTLEEYYVPRAEREILEAHKEEVVALAPVDAAIAELGSGDSAKTRTILDAFHRRYGRVRYLPIDIAHSVLEESGRALLAEFGGLEVHAIAGEYGVALGRLRERRDLPKVILFLGSNIGNFDRDDAARFLATVRDTMSEGDLLLAGIDLRKDRAILEPAYDDPKGVTAAFNLNLLARINRELRANFDLSAFAHRAEYQEVEGRIAMYLESLKDQTVRIGGPASSDRVPPIEIDFAAGERIHTEYSYKYSAEEIDALASRAGLRIVRRWTDSKGYFGSILFSR
jgi:dimethylhistidine N-methyltransferase